MLLNRVVADTLVLGGIPYEPQATLCHVGSSSANAGHWIAFPRAAGQRLNHCSDEAVYEGQSARLCCPTALSSVLLECYMDHVVYSLSSSDMSAVAPAAVPARQLCGVLYVKRTLLHVEQAVTASGQVRCM
jgi:hypothetical protein